MPNLNNTQKTVLEKQGDKYIFKIVSEDASEALDNDAAIEHINNLIEAEKQFLNIGGDDDDNANLDGDATLIQKIDEALRNLAAQKEKAVKKYEEEKEQRKEAKERLKELRKLRKEILDDKKQNKQK